MIFNTYKEANLYITTLTNVTRIAIVATGILVLGNMSTSIWALAA